MIGAVAGPGSRASLGPGGTALPRFWAAVALAVAMHAALLAIRPGGLTANYVVPAAGSMAVRILRPLASTSETTRASLDAAPASKLVPSEKSPAAASTSTGEHRLAHGAAAKSTAAAVPAKTRTSAANEARRADLARKPATDPAQPSATETPLPAAPDYALGIRLDPGPRPLDEIEPDYPDPVHLREGTVVLRLLISDTGHVDDVAVVRSQPRGVFEQAAVDAFAKARFAPGMAGGTPVKSQITVEVQFVPINRGARVSGRTY